MSIASVLTRKLDIRFIDARVLYNEARVSLGIEGYPSEEEERLVLEESFKIFGEWSSDRKMDLKRLHTDSTSSSMSSEGESNESSLTSTDNFEDLLSCDEKGNGKSKKNRSWLRKCSLRQ